MHGSGRPASNAQLSRPGGRVSGRSRPGRRHVDPAAIARRLGAVVQWPGSASVRDRSWRLIAQARDFDAWLIAWPGGTVADLHDHGGSRGALHVISGSLVETIPWRDDRGTVTIARREVHTGATLAFGAGHVHDVRNEDAAPALSLHVYSPPLTSMIYYDRSGDRLIPREHRWDISREGALSGDRSVLGLAP
jgi:mannose-6-phosphate isomerase-like protein (cupin superfamily)